MNSKLFFLIALILTSSCGVKGPPAKFPEQAVDSYLQEYTGRPDNIKSDNDDDKYAPTSSPLGI